MKSNTQLSEQIKFRASKACVQSVHSLLQQGPNNFISGIMLLEVVGPERMKLISGLKFYAIDNFYSEHCRIYIIFWVLRTIIGILLCPSLLLFHHTPLLVPFYFSLFMWLDYELSLIWRLGARNLQWVRTWEMFVWIFISPLNFFFLFPYIYLENSMTLFFFAD